MKRRRPLTHCRAVWRDQAHRDHELTPATFKLAYEMADCMTMESTREKYERTGRIVIFPSQERLRLKTGLSLDTIREGVKQLIKRGHLTKLKRGNQFTGSNRYKVLLKAERVFP